VRHVGVLRRDQQRPPLTTAADEDLGAARLDRPRMVQRLLDPVVLPLEAGPLLGEHEPADRERLVEAVHSLADRREVEAVAEVLGLVSRRRPGPEPLVRR